MKKFAEKLGEIMEIVLVCSIILAYIASVIYTQIRVPEYESGLPIFMGFFVAPLLTAFTTCGPCNGAVKYTIAAIKEKSIGLGIVALVLSFVALFFLYGTVAMISSVTGIYNFGIFTY